MPINWNVILENAIVGHLISALIDEGYRVQLSDQDGGGLYLYAMPDGDEFPANKGGYNRGDGTIAHWARLVPGNGPDIISDYSTNLETTIKATNEFAAAFQA